MPNFRLILIFLRKQILTLILTLGIFFSSVICQGQINQIDLPESIQAQLQSFLEENRDRAEEHFSKNHWGIEVLTAGSSVSSPASIFGHTLLRLLDDDANPLNDTIIGFEMLVVDPNQTYLRAFRGGYETLPIVREFSTYLQQYTVGENRTTKRIILPAGPMQIRRIKENFMRMLNITDLIGDYLFINNNCATAMLKLLGSSGYMTPSTLVDIPTLLESRLRFSMLSSLPAIELPSVTDILFDSAKRFDRQQRDAKVSCQTPFSQNTQREIFPYTMAEIKDLMALDSFWDCIKVSTNDYQKAVLIHFFPQEVLLNENSVAQQRQIIHKLMQFTQAYEHAAKAWPIEKLVQTLPREIYMLCELNDSKCRGDRLNHALQIWPRDQLISLTRNFPGHKQSEMVRSRHLIPRSQRAMQSWLESVVVQDAVQFAQELQNQN